MRPHPIKISSFCCAVKPAGRVARNFKNSVNELGEPFSPCDLIRNDGCRLVLFSGNASRME
jgi:hypothetical protein